MPEIRIHSDAYRTREVPALRRGMALKFIGVLGRADTEVDLCRRAVRNIADGEEIRFACVYLLGPERTAAKLSGSAGVEEGTRWAPRFIDFDSPAGWPIEHVAETGEGARVGHLEARFGAWPGSLDSVPRAAELLPIRGAAGEPVRAILVVGFRDAQSAFEAVDERMKAFLTAASERMARALARARTRSARLRSGNPRLPGF